MPVVEFAYNNAESASSSMTPFHANLGYDPSTPADVGVPGAPPLAARLQDVHDLVRANVSFAKDRQAQQANRKRVAHPFAVGDHVRLNAEHLRLTGQTCSKLKDRFLGPFTIVEQVSPVSFRLQLPTSMRRVHPVFHVDRLEVYHTSDFAAPAPPRRPPVQATDANTFDADAILDVDFNRNKSGLRFLVRWAAPWDDPSHDSWEPLRHVQDCSALYQFLESPRWLEFSAQRSYVRFADRFPGRVPEA